MRTSLGFFFFFPGCPKTGGVNSDRSRKKERKESGCVCACSFVVCVLTAWLSAWCEAFLRVWELGMWGSSFFFKHFRELLFLGLFGCFFFFPPFLLLGFAHTQLSKRIQVECEKREEEEEGRRCCRQTEEVCPCIIYCFGRKSSKIRDVVVFASVSWSPPALEKEQKKTRKKERKKKTPRVMQQQRMLLPDLLRN